MSNLKLMVVMAHPDDETLGVGGVLAKYAAEGVEVSVITATRGEVGWPGPPEDYPGPDALGKIREAELGAAAEVLGVNYVSLLDYYDGKLDQADPDRAVARVTAALRNKRPDVVLTFDPFGVYGHPDHIAISQITTAAVARAASAVYTDPMRQAPHRVSKLYYRVGTQTELDVYQQAFGELAMTIDGVQRSTVSWPGWSVTTVIDTRAYEEVVWRAVECYRSQIPNYRRLLELPENLRHMIWSEAYFYRVFSLVNGRREKEIDLFAGLRREKVSLPGSLLSSLAR